MWRENCDEMAQVVTEAHATDDEIIGFFGGTPDALDRGMTNTNTKYAIRNDRTDETLWKGGSMEMGVAILKTIRAKGQGAYIEEVIGGIGVVSGKG